MLRATLKSLLARKVRLVLSALSVVIGVGFVSGAFVLTDSLSKTFDGLFSDVNENIAVAVRGEKTTSGDFGDIRKPMPESVLETIRSVEGVELAEGSVIGNAQVVGVDGDAVTSNGPPTLGLTWVDGPLLSGSLISGTAPTSDDQIVLNALLAEEAGYQVGDQVPVLTEGPKRSYELAGILGYDDGRKSLGGELMVAFTREESQRALGREGAFDEIDVIAAGGVGHEELRDRITAALPAGTEAVTGQQLADEQAGDIKEGLGFFNTFLLVFAGIALFVGAFIIFNTFSMLVAQRSRELALMRALGASRGQVVRSVLAEAVLVGFIASALGLLAGIGLSYGLQSLLRSAGIDFPDAPLVIATRTVVVAFTVGILVTAVAALLPARKGSRIPPIEALRDAATTDKPLGRQAVAGGVLLVVGVAAITASLNGAAILWLGLGAIAGFLGIALLSPLLAKPIAGTVGLAFRRGIPGRLGGQNTVRNPRRTAVTASALMIGLALISGVSVLGASIKESVAKITEGAVGAEFLLSTSGPGYADEITTEVGQVQGVETATPLKGEAVKVPSGTEWIIAVPPEAVSGGAITLKGVSGDSSTIGTGEVLISEDAAEDGDLAVGATVPMYFADGSTQDLRVRGIYETNALAGNYLVGPEQAEHFSNKQAFTTLVTVADGADTTAVRSGLEKAVEVDPRITIEDRSEFIQSTQDEVSTFINFLNVLLALSVLIAILGVINTLALSVIERTRELGLLRAVGMSRRQVKRMIRVESVVICIFGGILGLIVGTGLGAAVQHALAGEGITELAVPGGTLAGYLVLAAVAGVVAALLPARRAARLDVLKAVATE